MGKWSTLTSVGGGGGGGISNYCIAYNSSPLVTAYGNPIPFDTNAVDTASFHSTSVNTTRFTAPKTGLYQVLGQAQFNWLSSNPSSVQQVSLQLRKNGSIFAIPFNVTRTYDFSQLSGPIDPTLQIAAIVQLALGDYLELIGNCTDTTDFIGYTTEGCSFSIMELA